VGEVRYLSRIFYPKKTTSKIRGGKKTEQKIKRKKNTTLFLSSAKKFEPKVAYSIVQIKKFAKSLPSTSVIFLSPKKSLNLGRRFFGTELKSLQKV
jgi:hypothetical protein